MEPLLIALPVLGVYLVAVVSPGPNIVILTRTTLENSRKAGVLTALGFAAGACIYVAAGFLGITAFISRTPWLYQGLRALGGGYIIYIGLRVLRKWVLKSNRTSEFDSSKPVAIPQGAFLIGLITMLTNPRAGLLMLGLFTTSINPDSPPAALWIMATGMPLLTFLWHGSLAYLLSNAGFRKTYLRSGKFVVPLLGLVLLYFGLQILCSVITLLWT